MEKVKKNDIPWGEGPAISLITGVSQEAWVIPPGFYLSDFNKSVVFNIVANVPEVDYNINIYPNLPSLTEDLYMYILPNPEIDPNGNFNFIYTKRTNGTWQLSDTGQQHLFYPYNQTYTLLASNESWPKGEPMPSSLIPILNFSISEDKLLNYQVVWDGSWFYVYYDSNLSSYQKSSGHIKLASGESQVNSRLSITLDILRAA